MTSLNKLGGALLAAGLLAAAPAAAHEPPERSRTGRVAQEIARGIEEAAIAVGTVTEAMDNSLGNVRFSRAERFAIRRCEPRVEQYGQMRVDTVRPYGRRSIRVYGLVGDGGWGDSRYERRGYRERSFTCTVRDDGRVRLKTRRL